ncbi:hypothetical protein BJ508DRAFT_375677 [Ascobolus immersus RN42]|uniref:Uncharacterized protein n=1 Tax=Ascobolus immersus RN42 TaxID=1160509 RepID=A0A3N4I9A8_ASCIM|nr:hypothetical protein BJ508DRAFT_375677 [Ascobolus immersus RN42]
MAPVSSYRLLPTVRAREAAPPSTAAMPDAMIPSAFNLYCDRKIAEWRTGVIVLSCLLFAFFLTSLFLLGRVITLRGYLKNGKHLEKEMKKKKKAAKKAAKKASSSAEKTGPESGTRSAGDLNKPLPSTPNQHHNLDDVEDTSQARTNERHLAESSADTVATTSTDSKEPLIRRVSRRFERGGTVDVGAPGSASNKTDDAGPSNQEMADAGEPNPNPEERKPGWIAAYFTGPAWTKDKSGK